MADTKDLQNQLEIQQQINAAIQARQQLIKSQTSQLSGQVSVAMELCNALKCENLDGMADRIQEISEGLESAAESAAEFGEEIAEAGENASEAAQGTSGGFRDMAKSIKPAHAGMAGFFGGLASGFAGGLMDIKSFISLIGTAVKAIFKIGMAIFSIPFQILGGLVGMANDLQGGTSALRQAVEDLRASFGDLAVGEAAATMDAFKGIKEQGGDLAGTGLSIGKVFGIGSEGMAAAMKYAQKVLEDTGNAGKEAFKALNKEQKVQQLMMMKGLGISGEGFNKFAKQAKLAGKDTSSYMMDVSKSVLKMSKKFGISGKEMMKDLEEMSGSFVEFGNLSTQEMLEVSVYARKLGVEVKDLKGKE